MAGVDRRAEIIWEGSVARGGGTVRLATSGVAGDLPVSLPTRAGDPNGETSPEELIAASHVGCYAMSLSGVLTRGGNPPERLEASADVTVERVDGGFKVTRSELNVRGRVPGLDAAAFEEAARQAERSCPISNAIRGNVEIGVTASLDEG